MSDFNILILDDDRSRLLAFQKRFGAYNVKLTIVSNAADAIRAITTTQYNIICLDHDLTEEQNKALYFGIGSGTQVASYLAGIYNPKNECCLRQIIFIHSTHSKAAALMFNILDSAGYIVHIRPHLWLQEVFDATMGWNR